GPPVSALERLSPGCFFSLAYASGACVQTLPDPCTYLIVEVPKVSAPRCVISGPRLKSVRLVPAEAMQVIGIRLRPGVAFLLTGVCTERWVGRRESLEDVLGPCVSELAVQISESPCTDAQFDFTYRTVRRCVRTWRLIYGFHKGITFRHILLVYSQSNRWRRCLRDVLSSSNSWHV